MVVFAETQRGRSAEIEPVVSAPDWEWGGKAARDAGEVEKPVGLAVALHDLDAFEGFERSDEDGRGDPGALAHGIEHEVRAVVEKNISVARGEIHRANTRSRSAKVMSGGIAGRISFRFHDATAEAASGEIVDYNFSDEKARQANGISRKLSATKTANH